MLDKAFLRYFYQWLDDATDEELSDKREQLRALLPRLEDAEVKRDTRYLLRRIEREQADRLFLPRNNS